MFYVVEIKTAKKNFGIPVKTSEKIVTPQNIKISESGLIVFESDHQPTMFEVKQKIRENDCIICGRPNWMEKDFQIIQIGPKIEKLNHCPFMGLETEKNLIRCGELLPEGPNCTKNIGCLVEKCVLKGGSACNKNCLDSLEKNSEIIPPWFIQTQKRKKQRSF
jgi:hypothetical protein